MLQKNLWGISMITLTCLYGLLAAVAIGICAICGASVTVAIAVSLIVLLIQFLIGPWITDLSMKFFYKVKFNQDIPEWLAAYTEEVCGKYGIRMPKLGLINDGAPNAFTYGRFRNDARIVVTRGTLELLTEEQVKAVVAHEIGHIVHLDMLVMTVAQVVPLVMYAIYESCIKAETRSGKSSSDSSKSDAGYAVAAIIAYVLYLISQLIILWLSRTREYYADAFSVEETKNPEALAGALVTIGYGLATVEKSAAQSGHSAASPTTLGISDAQSGKAMAVCCVNDGESDPRQSIRNAMKWDMWNIWAKLYEIGSTHPLISKRLLAISDRSEEFGQERYIAFDEQRPESYADDFAKECLICFLPWATLICALIALLAMNNMTLFSAGLIATAIFSLLKYLYRHPKNHAETTVRELLGEVKVSGVTAIPCAIEGEIIGRGNPGCVFNEDFVLKDSTGIVMLDYNQPLFIINKIFAMFKSKEYFGKTTKVTGWYRRSPVPYIEVKSMETDGVTKKCWTWQVGLVARIVFLVISVILLLICL